MADHASLLPPDLEQALRTSVSLPSAERARRLDAIMGAVHREPAAREPLASHGGPPSWTNRVRVALRRDLPPTISRWRRRGVLGSAGALAVAAMLTMWVGVTSLTDVLSRSAIVLARAEVIGDTVIPRLVPRVAPALTRATVGDTLYETLYDTMRIVRFALRAPSATRVAFVHTDNRSDNRSDARPAGSATERHIRVARDLASGLWELRTVVPRDAVARSYAFVVNETDRIPVHTVSRCFSEGSSSSPC